MLTAAPRLADIAQHPDRIDSLPFNVLPALMTELSALGFRLAARLANAPPPPASTSTGDRLLTARDVASRLQRSTKWVYAHARELPFAILAGGQDLRFSEHGLVRYIEMRQNAGSSTG